MSPVHQWGEKKKIKIYTPSNTGEKFFINNIIKEKVDLNIVVAYGNLLTKKVINLPNHISLNVHASLLPKWRGAAPIQRSILSDDKETGVKEGDPTGVFTMDETAAKAAAYEVLDTHKGITGSAADAYLATYFAKAWGHFDVNKSGAIPVVRTPEFMRFLCSDQNMSLGQ